MITVYAFGSVPPPVFGITRDLRVLWALEETGLPYRVQVPEDRGSSEYAGINPFGLIPAIDDDGFRLFESAAIVHYLADKAGALLPADARERALALQWSWAALNTLEPAAGNLAAIDKFYADQAWARERRPALLDTAKARLAVVERALADRPYLLGDAFSASDILMLSVLRFIQHTDLLDAVPKVAAFKARCEGRPAWKKCLAAYERRLAA